MVTASTSGAGRPGSCRGGSGGAAAGSVCALGAETETALEGRAGGSASSAGSAGSTAGRCERHDGGLYGFGVVWVW
jgi:hypothetical protein